MLKPDQPTPGQSLREWNTAREAYWVACQRRIWHPEEFPNGLVCPRCDGGLYDTGHMTNTSPPKLRVKCQLCEFKGDRYE